MSGSNDARTAADYEWLTLEPDEEIVWTGGPELVGYAATLALGALLIPVLGLGLLVIAGTYLSVRNTEYVVTTRRVCTKTGVLSRSVTDVGAEKIQDTSYGQTAVDRYFGVGRVEISTAGGSGVELSFEHVADPAAVQSTVDEATRAGERARKADAPSGADLDGETLAELVEEMRATREALERIERRLR